MPVDRIRQRPSPANRADGGPAGRRTRSGPGPGNYAGWQNDDDVAQVQSLGGSPKRRTPVPRVSAHCARRIAAAGRVIDRHDRHRPVSPPDIYQPTARDGIQFGQVALASRQADNRRDP